jgi:CRISPR-associated protein Cas2
MATRLLHLACYDVSDDRRLRKALYILRDYATGGQKSVFECFLTPDEILELIGRVEEVINPLEDRFLLLRLDGRRPVRTLGIARQPLDPDFFYIG